MSPGTATTRRLEAPDTRVSVTIAPASRFEALRPEWDELLRASASNTPFLTWEWLFAWWTHLHGSSRLQLHLVYVGPLLVAVAPLQMTRARLPWFSSLELLGTGCAGSDYLDLIVRRGFETEAIDALAVTFSARGTTLSLTHLPPDALALRLAQRLEDDGWTRRDTDAGVCPVIRLAGHTWDSYLATRSAAHRANVRRRLRAADRTFTVRFERVTSPRGRFDALTALARFHDARWTGRTGSSAFHAPGLTAFHQDATRHAEDAGWLRLYTLSFDDRIIGVMYAFAYDGLFYFYQHGVDERSRDSSPGLMLMALTIRAAIDEGARAFDLLWGLEAYKHLWADDARTLGRVDLFPARLAGRLHHRRVEAESTLRALVRRLRTGGDHAA